jgi:hypothetical protein
MYLNFLILYKIKLNKIIIYKKKYVLNKFFYLNSLIYGIILQKNINQITILIVNINYYIIHIYYDIKIILILN